MHKIIAPPPKSIEKCSGQLLHFQPPVLQIEYGLRSMSGINPRTSYVIINTSIHGLTPTRYVVDKEISLKGG